MNSLYILGPNIWRISILFISSDGYPASIRRISRGQTYKAPIYSSPNWVSLKLVTYTQQPYRRTDYLEIELSANDTGETSWTQRELYCAKGRANLFSTINHQPTNLISNLPKCSEFLFFSPTTTPSPHSSLSFQCSQVGIYKRKVLRKKRKKAHFRPRKKVRFKKKKRKHAKDQEKK